MSMRETSCLMKDVDGQVEMQMNDAVGDLKPPIATAREDPSPSTKFSSKGRPTAAHKAWSTLGFLLNLSFVSFPRDVWEWLRTKRKSVRGQVVVITGGGSGIGAAVAERLALQHGARLALIDVNENGVRQVAASIVAAAGEARPYVCDVSDEMSLAQTADAIRRDMGHPDIVVCNAAVMFFGFFMELSSQQLRKAIDVNLIGAINTIRAFLAPMEERNSGQVVCISSIAGHVGDTYGLAYCPSKFALIGVMESLKWELKDRGLDGIKCTTICPYFTRTPMVVSAGMRPTSTWFPFMSTLTCSRLVVDAILREDPHAFIPKYIRLVALLKIWMPTRVHEAAREYLNCKYEPLEITKQEADIKSKRQLLPAADPYWVRVNLLWYVLILLPLLLLPLIVFIRPDSLRSLVTASLGSAYDQAAASVIEDWKVRTAAATIVLVLVVVHLIEAAYAVLLCDRLRQSYDNTARWFLQTLCLGAPSLRHLRRRWLDSKERSAI